MCPGIFQQCVHCLSGVDENVSLQKFFGNQSNCKNNESYLLQTKAANVQYILQYKAQTYVPYWIITISAYLTTTVAMSLQCSGYHVSLTLKVPGSIPGRDNPVILYKITKCTLTLTRAFHDTDDPTDHTRPIRKVLSNVFYNTDDITNHTKLSLVTHVKLVGSSVLWKQHVADSLTSVKL